MAGAGRRGGLPGRFDFFNAQPRDIWSANISIFRASPTSRTTGRRRSSGARPAGDRFSVSASTVATSMPGFMPTRRSGPSAGIVRSAPGRCGFGSVPAAATRGSSTSGEVSVCIAFDASDAADAPDAIVGERVRIRGTGIGVRGARPEQPGGPVQPVRAVLCSVFRVSPVRNLSATCPHAVSGVVQGSGFRHLSYTEGRGCATLLPRRAAVGRAGGADCW